MPSKRVYIADYRDASGKRRRTQHATRAEADAVQAQGKADAAANKHAKLSRAADKAQGIAISAAAAK